MQDVTETRIIPEILQIGVRVLTFQQLTPDEIVAQAELRHGQNLSFVGGGVAGGAHQIIPLLSTRNALAAPHKLKTDR